jgi:predicted RNase H-like HicB family nuclease
MIAKGSIEKTAVCFWSTDDDCFVVQSPLFSRVIGIGPTAKEAKANFLQVLERAYEHLKSGKVRGYTKSGRPSEGGVYTHCIIRPETKDGLEAHAKLLGLSQGQMIDYAFFFYEKKLLDPSDKLSHAATSQYFTALITADDGNSVQNPTIAMQSAVTETKVAVILGNAA